MVTKAEFAQTGFTDAHLGGARFVGYRTMGTLVTEVDRLVRSGEPFVYAYYEGIDKVAHEYGLGDHYDTELRWVDHLVADLLAALPAGTVLAITADHGQVEVGENLVELDPGIRPHLSMQSGEGRFRWLHARPGRDAPAARGRRGPRRHGLGGARATRWSTRAGSARGCSTRCGPASATSPSSPGSPSPTWTRPTPGRTTSSAATAR